MKKITLHAIGNDGGFNYYIFDKKKEIYFQVSKMIANIFQLYLKDYDEKDKPLNVEKYTDAHFSAGIDSSNKSRCDVFYGKNKMFFVIHCNDSLRLKFNEELAKITTMPKPIKIKLKKTKK